MLKQKIEAERPKRLKKENYQGALNLFGKGLDETMSFLNQTFHEQSINHINLLDQLTKNAIIPAEKLNNLKSLLTKQSMLFNKEIQSSLLKIAQKKIKQDSFSGKLLHFYLMAINKDKIDSSIAQIKSYEEMDIDIAEQIIEEEKNEYKENQIFLFFEILADLVSTPEFQQVIQEQYLD